MAERPTTVSRRGGPRRRDPEGTRESILDAARRVLAQDGKEGLSVSQVAVLAKINRGTAYQHFQTREQLIAATTDWVSDKMYRAAFGKEGIDVEVHSVLVLAGTFLWPVWIRAHARTAKERQEMSERFTREMLRLALYGNLKPEKFPELHDRFSKQAHRS